MAHRGGTCGDHYKGQIHGDVSRSSTGGKGQMKKTTISTVALKEITEGFKEPKHRRSVVKVTRMVVNPENHIALDTSSDETLVCVISRKCLIPPGEQSTNDGCRVREKRTVSEKEIFCIAGITRFW